MRISQGRVHYPRKRGGVSLLYEREMNQSSKLKIRKPVLEPGFHGWV